MNRDELDSQLSAMYDGELPAAECELLSRRLVREEPLRATWSRDAAIGAALRAEPAARVHPDFARRVSARLAEGTVVSARRRLRRMLGQWAVGAGVAAGVAGTAILLLRQDLLSGVAAVPATIAAVAPPAASAPVGLLASRPAGGAPAVFAALRPSGSGEPASYVVPPAATGGNLAVPASLADYVLAHSEVSSPLVRRGLLSALVATETLEPAVMPSASAADSPTTPDRRAAGANARR